MSLEAQLQTASAAYQKLQNDMAKLVNSRQGLDAQLAENQAVKKEFDAIPWSSGSSSSHTVYKLVGPVLLKQDTAEAKANVDRRLEFLRAEMRRLDERITSSQSTIDNKRLELVHIQTQIQQAQQTAAQQGQGTGKGVPGAQVAIEA